MRASKRFLGAVAAASVTILLAAGCHSSSTRVPQYEPDSNPGNYQNSDSYPNPVERVDPAVDSDGNGRFNPSPIDPYQS